MDASLRDIIKLNIAPVVQSGRASLFIGAGFSIGTPNIAGETIPGTSTLIERILIGTEDTVTDPKEVDLSVAFSVGADEIKDFSGFLSRNFTCARPFDWQKIPFRYWWRRIYTTNIDTIINDCVNISAGNRSGPQFRIFNYRDSQPAIFHPLETPVVFLHGTVKDERAGFIFDGVSYADFTVRSGDWLHDAAYSLSNGNCIILGSRLKESDLEAELRKRSLWEGSSTYQTNPNWIVLDKINSIERKGYEKRGIVAIEATAKEFLEELSANLTELSASKLLKRIAPHINISDGERRPATFAWFVQNFTHVQTEVGKSKSKHGIFSKFFTGDPPEWFYIANDVPALFTYCDDICKVINEFYSRTSNDLTVYNISVVGPVASGKTTLCRNVANIISKAIGSVYEFTSLEGIDIESTWVALRNVKGPLLLFFDKSSEHFYSINELAKRFALEKTDARVVFLVEERDNAFSKSAHNLSFFREVNSKKFRVPSLSNENAGRLLGKLKNAGLTGILLDRRDDKAAITYICDTEKGCRGDLLATLCNITTGKPFKTKLDEEYKEITDEIAKEVFQVLTIVTAARMAMPITYLSEIFGLGHYAVMDLIKDELDGKVYFNSENGYLSSRHHVIAEHHIGLMTTLEKEKQIIRIMACVSHKFSIKDIKLHPLQYRIYKSIVHHNFITSIFGSDKNAIENIYTRCQGMFADDGFFWLQYGRFLYSESRLREAEHCYRKGYDIYESFQIIHALGQVLVKIYVAEGLKEKELFNDGTDILISEVKKRGEIDPYPYTALVDVLMDVLDKQYSEEVHKMLRDYVNAGLQIHRSHEAFKSVVRRYMTSKYDKNTWKT